jgi:hypothetical protein
VAIGQTVRWADVEIAETDAVRARRDMVRRFSDKQGLPAAAE